MCGCVPLPQDVCDDSPKCKVITTKNNITCMEKFMFNSKTAQSTCTCSTSFKKWNADATIAEINDCMWQKWN